MARLDRAIQYSRAMMEPRRGGVLDRPVAARRAMTALGWPLCPEIFNNLTMNLSSPDLVD
jgi:hypothetical protein